jgi:hypothetical protein
VFYVGHFTFNGEKPEDSPMPGPTTGWFTLIVEADTAETTLDKFGDLIESVASRSEVFDSVENVYLDDATEVKELPPEGVLAHWHEYPDLDASGSVSTTLPPEAPDGVAAFEWRSDEAGEEPEDGETVEPFYTFEED